MNVFIACALLVSVVMAEAPAGSGPYPAASGPYPPSGWRPSGPLLMLPARQQVSTVYGPPPSEYGPPTDTYGPPSTEATTEAEPTEQTSEAPAPEEATVATEGESEQLRDNGVYYVLMQDGRLQMVRYRTAPLRAQSKSQRQQKSPSNRFTDASSQRAKSQLTQVQAHQAQFQPRPAKLQQQPAKKFIQQSTRSNKQLNSQSARLNQQPFHYVEIQKSHEIEVAQPPPEVAPNGFVANLQYRNVEPISAPVFAYNSAPLTRILKK